jgi:hypothetical protein
MENCSNQLPVLYPSTVFIFLESDFPIHAYHSTKTSQVMLITVLKLLRSDTSEYQNFSTWISIFAGFHTEIVQNCAEADK